MSPEVVAAPLVEIARDGRLGRIQLNRPRKINALNLEMIGAIRAALATWNDDPSVAAVLITGAGERGLCAGGDIAAVFEGIRGGGGFPDEFWADEYRMNLDIAQYPKPVVSLMHGITFGGGIGVAAHAAVRVVTDSSLLAMPETAIGLAPDVGGLYLLARAPGELGTHAALTGARFGPAEALAAGLADFYVPAERLAELPERLADAVAHQSVDAAAAIVNAVRAVAAPAPVLAADSIAAPAAREWIDECYAGDDPIIVRDRLRSHPSAAARAAAETLAAMSPTAVAVTLRALRNAARLSLAEVLAQDLVLSVRFAAHPDFPEGIRAQIIDKDHAPSWRPATLDEVRAADVDAFFAADGPRL